MDVEFPIQLQYKFTVGPEFRFGDLQYKIKTEVATSELHEEAAMNATQLCFFVSFHSSSGVLFAWRMQNCGLF